LQHAFLFIIQKNEVEMALWRRRQEDSAERLYQQDISSAAKLHRIFFIITAMNDNKAVNKQ
jgi:hypothetical protein